jgi:hypothetical protein
MTINLSPCTWSCCCIHQWLWRCRRSGARMLNWPCSFWRCHACMYTKDDQRLPFTHISSLPSFRLELSWPIFKPATAAQTTGACNKDIVVPLAPLLTRAWPSPYLASKEESMKASLPTCTHLSFCSCTARVWPSPLGPPLLWPSPCNATIIPLAQLFSFL